MALIAPGVARFSIIGSIAGQDVINVIDIKFSPADLESRAEGCARLAGDLLNQWSDHILPTLCNEYTAIEVRWVDLDSISGSTGAVNSTDGSTWPEAGSASGDPLPNNVYAKMVKVLEGKTRVQRNGALRLSGIPRTMIALANANELTAGARTDLATRFEDLKDGINGAVSGGEQNIVVVHTVGDVFTSTSDVAQFSPALNVGTIRRRMPGYGS